MLINVTIPVRTIGEVVFLVEVCSENGSCFMKKVPTVVAPVQENFEKFSQDLKIALTSRNFQAILQLIVYHDSNLTVFPQVSFFCER